MIDVKQLFCYANTIIKWYQFEGLNIAQIHKCSCAHKFERLDFRLCPLAHNIIFFIGFRAALCAVCCVLNLKMFIDND
jgi:hypothetical protein